MERHHPPIPNADRGLNSPEFEERLYPPDPTSAQRWERRFVLALRAWGPPADACHECLQVGVHLRAEGDLLSFERERTRDRILRCETQRSYEVARASAVLQLTVCASRTRGNG